jgi:hypothetical protein
MEPKEFLPQFVRELEAQLDMDNARWDDTWLKRSGKGQADRIYGRIQEYYREARMGKVMLDPQEEPVFVDTMPWLKIAGLALIGWIRDRYPEHFPEY